MNESDNVMPGGVADPASINSLIANLASEDGMLRVNARRSLVTIGGPSVPFLIQALANRNKWMRWEAAKALGQIGDPAATQALVIALEDRIFDVRWLAAEGLIAIGREALVPLLHALINHPDSLWLREGVHHVLHDLAKGKLDEVLQPVLAALEDIEPSVEVSFAAERALDALKGV
jgi:HEAT repeat protein